jgi:FdhD protein
LREKKDDEMNPANMPVRYEQVNPGQWTSINAEVIVETPVSLTVNGEPWLTFMCTPVDLEAMAVGFLYNENLIHAMTEIVDVRLCAAGDNIDVWLTHNLDKPDNWRRTSGCSGGITSVVSDEQSKPVINGGVLPAESIGALISQLFESQELYRTTGGVHTSALSDGVRIILAAEDIGRHNTLDKLAGRLLLDGIELPRRIILTTGRISSEMMQKANRMAASVVVSRTSPSSLSIDLARRLGITLIGYARRNQFNIYAHPERIVMEREHAQGSHF